MRSIPHPFDIRTRLERVERRRRAAHAQLADLRPAWPGWLLWTSDTGACYATRVPTFPTTRLHEGMSATLAADTPAELHRKLHTQQDLNRWSR